MTAERTTEKCVVKFNYIDLAACPSPTTITPLIGMPSICSHSAVNTFEENLWKMEYFMRWEIPQLIKFYCYHITGWDCHTFKEIIATFSIATDLWFMKVHFYYQGRVKNKDEILKKYQDWNFRSENVYVSLLEKFSHSHGENKKLEKIFFSTRFWGIKWNQIIFFVFIPFPTFFFGWKSEFPLNSGFFRVFLKC